MKVLVINSGSSSLKYKVFDMTDERVLASGLVEKIEKVVTSSRLHISLPVEIRSRQKNHCLPIEMRCSTC